ncbi:hypothetical protein B566_EDAN019384, partial [Ephemera danica]
MDRLNDFSANGMNAADYAVPYMWGTSGILYNTKHISADEAKSWACMWNPKNKGKMLMKDSYPDAFNMAAVYGYRNEIAAGKRTVFSVTNDHTDSDFSLVEKQLKALKNNVAEVKEKVPDDDKLRVVKAQVHAGGRGKAGGVKLARTKEEVIEKASQILGMNIKGLTVEKVMVAQAVDIEKEFYVGLINDRNSKSVTLMASAEGGVEIEEVAKTNPEKIIKMTIDPTMGLMDWQARKIALQLMSDPDLIRQTASILAKLYKLYIETDASLAEINPL